VTIESPPIPGIVKLPLTAVTQIEGRSAVWLLDPASMTVKAQPIAIGGADGNQVVVAAGLTAGQRVVTAGVHVQTPGQKVSLYVEPSAAVAPATQYATVPASASAAASAASR
jgi:multidrug efflux pump subunit AcrA (membrane-fusion protein)